MPLKRVSIAVAASGFIVFLAPSVLAFEVGGLASGMRFEDVKALAEAQGWSVEKGPEDASIDYSLSKPDGGSAALRFCDERLYSVSAQVPDGFKGLVAIVKDLTKAHGNPAVHSDTSPSGFEPVIAQLSFSWTFDDGEHSLISYGAADDLSREGVQLSPNAVFLFDDAAAVCGGSRDITVQPK